MIIVSQDKGKIINFDNMTRVYITFDEGDDDVCIRTETVSLKTKEERATPARTKKKRIARPARGHQRSCS